MWSYLFALWSLGGGIGAVIAILRDRHPVQGFLLGFGLSFIGLLILCLLPRGVPNLGPGRYAVRCPVCNAVQNVVDSDNAYKCWQCHSPTILHTVDDIADEHGRHTVECPICTKKAKVGPGIRYTCSCGSQNNLALFV